MSETHEPYDRRLLLIASVLGMGAIIAMPMSAAAPATLSVLVFCLPVMLGVIARMRRSTPLLRIAFVLLLLVALALIPGFGVLGVVAAGVVVLGPVVAVVAVGAPLRDVDVPAAAAFLLGGTIAVIVGFAASGLAGAAPVVVAVAVAAEAVVVTRLTPRTG